jgi:hypothetical protein
MHSFCVQCLFGIGNGEYGTYGKYDKVGTYGTFQTSACWRCHHENVNTLMLTQIKLNKIAEISKLPPP